MAHQGHSCYDRPYQRSAAIVGRTVPRSTIMCVAKSPPDYGIIHPLQKCVSPYNDDQCRGVGTYQSTSELRGLSLLNTSDSVFLKACISADDNYIRKLMTSRILTAEIVNYVDETGKTGVSHICTKGNLPLLELITPIPALNINISDKEGNAPLHFVAQAGHVDILQHLLTNFKSLEVDIRNIFGFTPLMKASLQGRTKCVKALLSAGASSILRDQGRGLCSYEWAKLCGRQSCAEVLEKFMKSNNASRSSKLTHLNDMEKWNSEPNLPLFPWTDNKEGWFHQKFKKAFKANEHTQKSEYCLVSNLTSAALCASSLGAPSSVVKPDPISNTSGLSSGQSMKSKETSKTMDLPKLQVTDSKLES